MRFRVLGCYGAELSHRGTSGFLVNQSLLLDAGTICTALSITEQQKIRHILISHIHADHTKGLPLLSENLFIEDEVIPVEIIAIQEVLDGLKKHLFNDEVWPDFTKIPNEQYPVFRMRPIKSGETIRLDGVEITAINVNHIVPCTGFVIREGGSSLIYSGDTYHTEEIWKLAGEDKDLKGVIIEASFPNVLRQLATVSKHLTPELLLKEFKKIGKPDLPLFTHHMKPRYLNQISQELRALDIQNLTILADGMTLNF